MLSGSTAVPATIEGDSDRRPVLRGLLLGRTEIFVAPTTDRKRERTLSEQECPDRFSRPGAFR